MRPYKKRWCCGQSRWRPGPADAALAEKLWQEAEELRDSAKEMLRLSMEKRLRAAEVQHRIDIHDQIESIDNSDEVWQKAAGTRRS